MSTKNSNNNNNFSKSISKQILSQTTTTTSAYGAPAQRLTLSPLILALNTLVAEFLYAQNCHFSLSVFCTEIPFRNTLPDFESVRCFRFTESEIMEILAAISTDTKFEKEFANVICRDYTANPSVSLLLLLLKSLLVKEKTNLQSEQKLLKLSNENHSTVRRDVKVQTDKRNFHHLNKYLINLSKKVQEMATQFEKLHQRSESKAGFPAPLQPFSLSPLRRPQPHQRLQQGKQQQQQQQLQQQTESPLRQVSMNRKMKKLNRNKCENINRSMERITYNFNQMTKKKRNNFRIIPIVKAIDAMSKQFEKCASRFEEVSEDLKNFEAQRVNLSNQAQPIATQTTEKSYIDWIHEMRTTSNGERFLMKIESALSKTLKKQRQELQREVELKLTHQKELLRVKYKQKLLEKLTKLSTRDTFDSGEGRNENYYKSVEKKLQEFESRHYDLLIKIERAARGDTTNELRIQRDNRIELLETEQTEENPTKFKKNQIQISQWETHAETSTLSSAKPHTPNQSKPDEKEVVDHIICDANVDHIICDAKMRIRELEFESNQLEQSFCHYLEKQRLQKEARHRAAEAIWNKYSIEKRKIENKFQLVKRHMKKYTRERRRRSLDSSHDNSVDSEGDCNRWLKGLNVDRSRKITKKSSGDDKASKDSSVNNGSIVFTNAIYEAQSKLFHNQSKLKKCSRTSTNLDIQMQEMDVNSSENIPKLIERTNGNIALPTTMADFHTKSDLKKVCSKLQMQKCMGLPSDVAESTISTSRSSMNSLVAESPTNSYKGDTDSSSDTLSKSIGTCELRVKKTLDFVNFDASANKSKDRNEQQQQQLQHLKQRLRARPTNLHPSKEETKTFTLFQVQKNEDGKDERKSKLVPTSLVLKQSMAKMNKLFEVKIEKEKRLRKQKSSEKATSTKAMLEPNTRKYERKEKLAAVATTKEAEAVTTTLTISKAPSIGGNQPDGYNDMHGVDMSAASSVTDASLDEESLTLSSDGDSGGCYDGCGDGCASGRSKLKKKRMKYIEKNQLTKPLIKAEEMIGVATDVEALAKIATMSEVNLQTEVVGVILEKGGTMQEEEQLLAVTRRQSKETLVQNNSYCPSEVFKYEKIIGDKNKQVQRKQQKEQKQQTEEQKQLQSQRNEREKSEQQIQHFYDELEAVHANLAPMKCNEVKQQQIELGEIVDDMKSAAVVDKANADKGACLAEIVTTRSECSGRTTTSIELEEKGKSQSSSEFWE